MGHDDGGLSLPELLVVVLTISVLATIALPLFLNQRQDAMESAVKSDLRNAVVHLEQHSWQTNGVVDLANLATRRSSPNVAMIAAPLPASGYCLEATHTALPGHSFTYRTDSGRIDGPGATC